MITTPPFAGVGVAPQVLHAVGRTPTLVRVTFNEAMTNDAELIDATNYTVIPTGVGSTPTVTVATPQTGSSPLYVDLTLDLAMTDATEYEATVDVAVTDLAGNPLDGAADSALFTSPTAGEAALAAKGLVEALTEIFGEEQNLAGGLRMTRTTAVVSATDVIVPVETTFELPTTGKFGLDGIVYYYTGTTATSFTGVSHIAAGASVAGARIQHRVNSTVVDLSGQYSALDLLRRGFLVNYAEGDDLSALARNLGVNRLPIFRDDDQFRAVVKALAYSPRGTVLALETALESLLGAGNYEVYEDLVQHPCTVFIRIDPSVFMGASSAGKAYMNPVEWDALAGGQDELVLSRTPLAVAGVQLHDLEELFDFKNAKPSAITYDYYPGAAPAGAFTYAGVEAETQVTVSAGEYTQLVSAAGNTVYYEMLDTQGARIRPESYVEISAMLMIPGGTPISADMEECSITIHDGAFRVSAGFNNAGLGLFNTVGGGFLDPPVATVLGTWYEVTIKKFGTDHVELWLDGALIASEPYASFASVSAVHKSEWGIRGAPNMGMTVRTKQFGYEVKTDTDFWNARGVAGSVAGANPTRFNDNIALLGPADVGKYLTIRDASLLNPQFGNANGHYLVDSFVGAGVVELIGAVKPGATVGGTPTRIIVDDPEAFTYPDDLGKEIVISGSGTTNDGTYVIEKLLVFQSPATYKDLRTPAQGGDYDSGGQITVQTNICEVVAAAFVPEVDLNYRLDPVFVNDGALSWELSDASLFVADTLTLVQPLWVNGLIMQIRYSDVLTAQILADNQADNAIIDTGPPVLYEYYPFYLQDILGLIRAFVDAITAAGVIPEFLT